MQDFFTQGTQPGALTSGQETRILVCHLLNSVKKPLSPTQINSIVQQDGLVNYFELSSCIAQLIRSGHIVPQFNTDGEDFYTVTELGIETAKTFERTVPKSVRDKAVKAAIKLLARIDRDRTAKTNITPCGDGYNVELRMVDVDSDLMSLSVFLPEKNQAESVRREFLNDPALVYKGILALLTGDLKAVGELIPSKEAELYREDDID